MPFAYKEKHSSPEFAVRQTVFERGSAAMGFELPDKMLGVVIAAKLTDVRHGVLPLLYFLRYADGEMPTLVLKTFEK